ncbi:MAG: chloramphenicol acetyltransferase [Paracoccaceae bacterium]
MARLRADEAFIHPECEISESRFGRFVEIGRGSRVSHSSLGDYSYCDRYADIANAEIGKFANIASFTRIGPTDHPMDRASLHHFHYRSMDYWDDTARDEAFFAHRHSRLARIGHDTWIGHGAVIRPEVTVGHGAVVAAGAVVTKDVAPYTIVAGVPAKPLKLRADPKIAERLMALAWWDWDHETLRARLEDFRRLPILSFLEKYECAASDNKVYVDFRA